MLLPQTLPVVMMTEKWPTSDTFEQILLDHVKVSLCNTLNLNLPQQLKWQQHHHWCVLNLIIKNNKALLKSSTLKSWKAQRARRDLGGQRGKDPVDNDSQKSFIYCLFNLSEIFVNCRIKETTSFNGNIFLFLIYCYYLLPIKKSVIFFCNRHVLIVIFSIQSCEAENICALGGNIVL